MFGRAAVPLVEQGVQIACWIDIDPRKIGSRLWDLPIHAPEMLTDWRGPGRQLLCYVTNHGAREQIAAFLDPLGYRRGVDYLMVG